MSCQSAQLTVVKACSIKTEALLKDRPCYCAHLTLCSFAVVVVVVPVAQYPINDALTVDILHRNKIPSLPFQMRAYSDAVCYFEKMCFCIHCRSVCVCPSYLECTNFTSYF